MTKGILELGYGKVHGKRLHQQVLLVPKPSLIACKLIFIEPWPMAGNCCQ